MRILSCTCSATIVEFILSFLVNFNVAVKFPMAYLLLVLVLHLVKIRAMHNRHNCSTLFCDASVGLPPTPPIEGTHGWWDPALVPHPAIMLGHLIVPATPLIDTRAKIGTLKVYAWWHWTASYLLNPHKPFPAAREGERMLHVLALAPWVNMVTPSEPAFFWLLHHLLRAAAIADRVLLWPKFNCLAPWVKLAPVGGRGRNSVEVHKHKDSVLELR